MHNNGCFEEFVSPNELVSEYLLPANTHKTIAQFQATFVNIMRGQDPRLTVIVGPCSIDNPEAALEYAKKLSLLQQKVADRFFLIMRVYLEKPRTNGGWKGYLTNPHLNDLFDPLEGIRKSRDLLKKIAQLNVPIATEFLSPFTAPYIQDLVTWGSIGARTSGSTTHRQLASALPMPIGFKNSVEGCIQAAINGIVAASHPQKFLGISPKGKISLVTTPGNANCHVVLRGGTLTGPNYGTSSIRSTEEALEKRGLLKRVIIDCSHENSGKDPAKQIEVFKVCIEHAKNGLSSLFGVMLESYFLGGAQKPSIHSVYGQSITDPCLSWEETEKLLTSHVPYSSCCV